MGNVVKANVSTPSQIVSVLTLSGGPLGLQCDGNVTDEEVQYMPSVAGNWDPALPLPMTLKEALDSVAAPKSGIVSNPSDIPATLSDITISSPVITRKASGQYMVWTACSCITSVFTELSLYRGSDFLCKAQLSVYGSGPLYQSLSTFTLETSVYSSVQFSARLTSSATREVKAGCFRMMWLEIGG